MDLADTALRALGTVGPYGLLGLAALLALAAYAAVMRRRAMPAMSSLASTGASLEPVAHPHAATGSSAALNLAVRPDVTSFFDADTNTVSYVVKDPASKACAIIDSVMDLDYAAGRMTSKSAEEIVAHVQSRGLQVEWLIETHVHADHLSAAPYLQEKLGGKLAIGEHITTVQKVFGKIFNEGTRFQRDGSQFDRLFKDGDTYRVGSMSGIVMHTPGHTPACTTHVIGDAAFVGDTLFMPDGGTARADFPGGDARQLYRSIKRLLELPGEMRLFMCHDYAPGGRELKWETTVAEERAHNIHVREGISEDEFVTMRTKRDATLAMPRLIIPSIQVNMRGGQLPEPDDDGKRFLKVPINGFEDASAPTAEHKAKDASVAQQATANTTAKAGATVSTIEIKKLSDAVSVTAQVAPTDIDAIAAAGFKSLICNRPDGEAPDQPAFATIAEQARARGLVVHHQPVVSGKVDGDNVADFAELVEQLPKPILAYCRTGTRSSQLWNLWQSE